MSEAHEILKPTKTNEWATGIQVQHFWADCSACNFTRYLTDTVENYQNRKTPYIADHLEQHEPGRALDIAVDWEISALCSVCDDGVGEVEQIEPETIECQECGTTWKIDGTLGERIDHD